MRHSRQQLLATIADLYYNEQCSQSQIALQTGYSRSAISRLLSEARENGVVEIRINHPLKRSTQLENAIAERYDLKACFVAQRGQLNYSQMLRLLGRLGAAYLSENMQQDSRLGIGWGAAVQEVAQSFRQRYWPDFQVIQTLGSISSSGSAIDGYEVAYQIASTFSGTYHTFNAPMLVGDRAVTEALMRERNIRKTLDLAKQIDFALVGIGTTVADRSGLLRSGYMTGPELNAVREQGAVGDFCSRLFDENGRILDIDINHRVIGADITALPADQCTVMGVAGGRLKAPAIRAALKGKLINALVTDSSAAEIVLYG